MSITAARRKVFISSTWLGKCVTGSNRGTRWPSFRDASVGIHPLGLLVLDIDGPLGEANLRKLRERYPLPQTLKVISGNSAEPSHYQFFYRLPDGYRAIPRPLDSVPCFRSFDKIDLKGSGGQVVGPGALERLLPEGEGQIVYDVHGDSLFLRYLGHNADLAKRYHVFSGEFLRPGGVIALGAGITAARRVLLNRLLPGIESPVLRRQAMRRVERWHLPVEISDGDLVVSMQSALLKGAGHATRTALSHEKFVTDEMIIQDVMDSIKGK